MGMLDRIKKRQIDGLKEFVQNMEITNGTTRVPILTVGILEDPIFMGWVMKNIKTFDDFLNLPTEEIEAVFKSSDRIMSVFAKCMYGCDQRKLVDLETIMPRFMSKFKDEFSFIKEVSTSEKESARYFIVKTVRKLQSQELIQGFDWKLPPMDIYYFKALKDGPGEIFFENGNLAAAGEHIKGRRSGYWKHFFETGKLLAEGDYLDGLKTGSWLFYYGNGEKRSQGIYKGDQRNGVWKEWDRGGNLTEVEYLEGVKQK